MGWQRLKVYTPDGTYIASCQYLEDAATIVLHSGAGASVRLGYSKWETIYSLPKSSRRTIPSGRLSRRCRMDGQA